MLANCAQANRQQCGLLTGVELQLANVTNVFCLLLVAAVILLGDLGADGSGHGLGFNAFAACETRELCVSGESEVFASEPSTASLEAVAVHILLWIDYCHPLANA